MLREKKEYLLSKALAIAQREAQVNYSRMRDLSDASQASPNEVADIKAVLEEKDLQSLTLKSRPCSVRLNGSRLRETPNSSGW